MIINVVDERSPSRDFDIARERDFHPVDVETLSDGNGRTLIFPRRTITDRLIVVRRGTSISRIVGQIVDTINSAGGGRQLWLLRLISHGNSGWMQLGSGLNGHTAGPFRRLQSHFNRVNDPRQGLELHGCAVAAAGRVSAGQCGNVPASPLPSNNLLQRLADLTGVPVRAGVCRQYPDFDMRIEGAAVTAHPTAGTASR